MISRLVASTMLAGAVALAFPASAEEKAFPATLKAHAILPANTIIAAPEDAAEHLKTSGKFTTADRKRAEGIGTVEGKDGVRKTGLSVPFDGQPVQGFSGIKTMEDGSFWSLSD
ncbi:glycerophosphodiester phosphodiesterase, partial [Staphylococcus aureus]